MYHYRLFPENNLRKNMYLKNLPKVLRICIMSLTGGDKKEKIMNSIQDFGPSSRAYDTATLQRIEMIRAELGRPPLHKQDSLATATEFEAEDIDKAWQTSSNCLDFGPDFFFPKTDDINSEGEAKKVCDGCNVREDCLEFALKKGEEFGIWGGMSERERRRIRRQRALGRVAAHETQESSL